MSLRLRLSLFYTLLLAAVLGLADLGLYAGLRQVLLAQLEGELSTALGLARPLLQADEGEFRIGQEGELLPRLPVGLGLLLYRADGRLVQQVGARPNPLPKPLSGCARSGEWQLCGAEVSGGYLLAAKPLEGVEVSLRALSRVIFVVSPLAVLLTWGLGYALAGRALAPVSSLTLAARKRALERRWDMPLPEPSIHDELFTLSQAFNGLLSTLGEVIEGERRFTQDAAHELRTPLTTLLGRLEQAQELNRDPQVAQALEGAKRSTLRLLALAERLLQLARAESGQGLAHEHLDLSGLAMEVVEELRPLFEAKGLELELGLTVPLWMNGDRLALGLALQNLLENALKFTSSGRVRLDVRPEGGWGVLEVSDSGPGIPAKALPHLFERFYQAEPEHRRGGCGLGLALVKAVVRWHGGGVSAANRPEGGACFRLWLPLKQGKP